jgi:hypothetical protein
VSPEDLRDARMAEARRLTLAEGEENLNPLCVEAFANHLCDLIEQDWRPEPEVDAVTLAFREWAKGVDPLSAHPINRGIRDEDQDADAFRAGHAHALANCADVRRMDWLEKQQNVTVDLLQPGGFLQCSGDADPLRAKIDRAMEGGQ